MGEKQEFMVLICISLITSKVCASLYLIFLDILFSYELSVLITGVFLIGLFAFQKNYTLHPYSLTENILTTFASSFFLYIIFSLNHLRISVDMMLLHS